MRNYLLILEGPHDVAAISKYLTIKGYIEKRSKEDVPEFWNVFIPTTFTFGVKTIIPTFFISEDEKKSVALYIAEGDSGIVSAMKRVKNLDYEELSAVGIVCDADDKNATSRYEEIFAKLIKGIQSDLKPIIEGNEFEKISNNDGILFGIYVLPNNADKGILEDLLLEGANVKFPILINHAEEYIDKASVSKPEYVKENDWSKNFNESKRKKMLVGVVSNAFRPGMANQVGIQAIRWVDEESLTILPFQKKFNAFLDDLLT